MGEISYYNKFVCPGSFQNDPFWISIQYCKLKFVAASRLNCLLFRALQGLVGCKTLIRTVSAVTASIPKPPPSSIPAMTTATEKQLAHLFFICSTAKSNAWECDGCEKVVFIGTAYTNFFAYINIYHKNGVDQYSTARAQIIEIVRKFQYICAVFVRFMSW